MLATSRTFEANARAGLANDNLQRALALMRTGFPQRRSLAVARLLEFEALRDIGKSIKDHTLEHLDFYLELYEANVLASGGRVHWARTPDEARAAVLEICRSVDAKIVTKGKSMIAEAGQLCDEARAVLRPRFLAADVGITGANFLVAETGSSIIVTNEGNGDLTQTLP